MAANRLGTRLRAVRELKKWSLKTTADGAGLSAAYVQKLERGEVASPSPHKLRNLADALELPYFELMQLAGYATDEAEATEGDAAVRVLAHALQAEDLTEEELQELARYLQFRRDQRRHEVA
jgi:transcriptional regulator with XRE-family HTH domain